MKGPNLIAVVLLLLSTAAAGLANAKENQTSSERHSKWKKAFSFLQVVKFPNDNCAGSANRNGTCYTSDECLQKKGVASGSCANGFGVCCIFSLLCGQTSSENCTYLTLGSTTATTLPTSCVYTLCECNPNVCRIRLDFMTFSIGGPVTATAQTTAPSATVGGAIGDCTTDAFVLSSPGNSGSPTICGINSGQHMIIDSMNGACSKAAFTFSGSGVTRSYDIKVTQYSCQDEMAGPPDCLQYFTSTTGVIKSFNFPYNAQTTVPASATHLSSQCYSFCFRRAYNKCAICFSPTVNPAIAAAIAQGSFGLSNPAIANAMAKSGADTTCISDYLVIPNSFPLAAGMALPVTVTKGPSRYCGRFLNADGIATSASLCTTLRPFKITFKTNDNEVVANAAIAGQSETFAGGTAANEAQIAGIVGFSLDYFQGPILRNSFSAEENFSDKFSSLNFEQTSTHI